jgi:hypothetical protein
MNTQLCFVLLAGTRGAQQQKERLVSFSMAVFSMFFTLSAETCVSQLYKRNTLFHFLGKDGSAVAPKSYLKPTFSVVLNIV